MKILSLTILFLTFFISRSNYCYSQTIKTKKILEITKEQFEDAIEPIKENLILEDNESFYIKLKVDDTLYIKTVLSDEWVRNTSTTNIYGPFTPRNTDNNAVLINFKDGKTVEILIINKSAEDIDTIKSPNLLAISFIKSIAGSSVSNELIDIFFKVNYGERKNCFSIVGVDAGINSSTESSNFIVRLNEAMVNINYNIFTNAFNLKRKVKKAFLDKNPTFLGDKKTINELDVQSSKKYQNMLKEELSTDKFNRVGFIGLGAKVFYQELYFGSHFGLVEVNGPLIGSYLLCGYYVSPFIDKFSPNLKLQTDSTFERSYKRNIYCEAGLNSFAKNAPPIIRDIKFKFGLLVPFNNNKDNTEFKPNSKDMKYRLSIEIPIGKIYKF